MKSLHDQGNENETENYFRETKLIFDCDIEEVAIYYKCVYFNAIDTIVACIQDRFNQPGFRAYENIDQLLLNAVNNENYEDN